MSSTSLRTRSAPADETGIPQQQARNPRAVFAGAALTAFIVTPGLADYYIVQEPTTKRCRIVEERPAPGVGVVIGGLSFGVRTEAESRMRTVEECRESGTTGGGVTIQERPTRSGRT